jgi:LPS-assembly lipoprotein
MSSSDRRTFVGMLALVPLAACGGFVPAYGPQGAARGLLQRVRIDDPRDKNSFDLVERLEERLGRVSEATYALSYTLSTSEVDLGVTPSNTITRYNVTGTVSFSLTALATGKVVSKATAETFTSYSASGTTVATGASRADAYRRLMRLLADQIVTRLEIDSGARAAP